MLPMWVGTYELFLSPNGDPNNIKKGDFLIDIEFDIDECIFENKQEKEWKDPKDCESNLYLGIVISKIDCKKNWLNDIYNKVIEYPDPVENEFVKREDEDFLVYLAKFPLQSIASKKDFEDIVISKIGQIIT